MAFQYRLEYVGVVVGGLSLQCAHQSLEAHAGVDNLGGKSFQAAVRLAVEPHEHEVPDFNHLRVVFVHQLAAGYFGLSSSERESTWISEHGPHGPVSPISQKLSCLLPFRMWSFGKNCSQ